MDPQQIDDETQKRLNEPLVDPEGISPEDEAFLNLVVAKVEAQEINLLKPSSLINHPVYEKLSEELQGKVDFDAMNLLTTLRNIYDLWKLHNVATFQIKSLVRQVRLTKEGLEAVQGDVFVI